MPQPDPYARNFEGEVNAALELTEAPGHKALIIGIYATSDLPGDAPIDALRVGGVCCVATEGATPDDVRFFIRGLETEAARLKGLIGE